MAKTKEESNGYAMALLKVNDAGSSRLPLYPPGYLKGTMMGVKETRVKDNKGAFVFLISTSGERKEILVFWCYPEVRPVYDCWRSHFSRRRVSQESEGAGVSRTREGRRGEIRGFCEVE